MKKLSLVVVVFGLVCLSGCWKKKTEEAKSEVPAAPVTQMPVEPVRESSPVAPAPAAEKPAPAPVSPAPANPLK